MERPNTISGLQSKRSELAKLHKRLIAEAKSVLCDLDHIDACIRLFDPEADVERVRLNRYATKHRAPKGHQKRFVLEQFRLAEAPITCADITAAWIIERGLNPDEATKIILRRRVSACLTQIKHDGLIESVGNDGSRKLWRLVASR